MAQLAVRPLLSVQGDLQGVNLLAGQAVGGFGAAHRLAMRRQSGGDGPQPLRHRRCRLADFALHQRQAGRDAVDAGERLRLQGACVRGRNSGLVHLSGEKGVDLADEVVAPRVKGVETGVRGLLMFRPPLLPGGLPGHGPG